MTRLDVPGSPPFAVRARLVTPLASGGLRSEPDALLEVDAAGRLVRVEAWSDDAAPPNWTDLRPWVVMPGLVDLHAHLPQLPNAGVGAGLDLLTWLERYIFPLERDFDAATADLVAPAVFRAMAAAGTTTVVAYGALWPDSLDSCFRAADAHGIRAVIGKVMMDRLSYDIDRPPEEVAALSLQQSNDLCRRWHGRDGGRLQYAFTPRFAVSCTAEMLRSSAAAAAETGAYWQTHLAEDREEMAEVRRLFPGAIDYTDVYDRAGGLTPRAILAHAIHLSDREVARLVETRSAVAHCPSSNLFLASGAMPLTRYLAAGVRVGLGSDVAAGPDVSLFSVMRAGAYTQNGLRAAGLTDAPPLTPAEWLRMGTLGGAQALGLSDAIGSLEVGKEADFIVVDPDVTLPIAGLGAHHEAGPDEMLSRLIFRQHPAMVRGAWVRGGRLPA